MSQFDNIALAIANRINQQGNDIGVVERTEVPNLISMQTTKNAVYTITEFDGTVFVDTSGGAITINLISTALVAPGTLYAITDKTGNASTNNITIDAFGAQTINGALTFTINNNRGSVILQSDGSNWFAVSTDANPSVAQLNYAHIYDTTTQAIAVANTYQNITFNTNAQLNGWTHVAATADIVCSQTGLYLITYIGHTERTPAGGPNPVDMRLTLNGVEIAGSQSGYDLALANENKIIMNTMLASVVATNTLRLQVAGGATNISLQPPATPGGAAVTPSANITITRIA